MQVQRVLLRKLCALCDRQRDIIDKMLYILSYAFLFRVRSECLGLRVCTPEQLHHYSQAVAVTSTTVEVRLRTRKNRPGGSRLTRFCTCKECPATCVLHVFGAWAVQLPPLTLIFEQVSASSALARLRQRVADLGTPSPRHYVLHDFRRGHAQDLLDHGAHLAEILLAGEWTSASFLQYLNQRNLNARAVLEAHMNMSSDEECVTAEPCHID